MTKTIEINGRRIGLATLTRTERNFARQWGDLPAIRTTAAPAKFTLPRLNLTALALAFVCSVAAGSAVVLATAPAAPVVQLIAETTTGESFIAGEGDTCQAAYQGAQFPAGPLAFVGCVIEGAR